MHCHSMRGTVLLLDSDGSSVVDLELLRADGLIVHHCRDTGEAVEQLQQMSPDVIVAVVPPHHSGASVPRLRAMADHATSILVASSPDAREEARTAGADAFLVNSAAPADLLFEIHRALILRRSGRRLPWNG